VIISGSPYGIQKEDTLNKILMSLNGFNKVISYFDREIKNPADQYDSHQWGDKRLPINNNQSSSMILIHLSFVLTVSAVSCCVH
jgi:hypothetical protein